MAEEATEASRRLKPDAVTLGRMVKAAVHTNSRKTRVKIKKSTVACSRLEQVNQALASMNRIAKLAGLNAIVFLNTAPDLKALGLSGRSVSWEEIPDKIEIPGSTFVLPFKRNNDLAPSSPEHAEDGGHYESAQPVKKRRRSNSGGMLVDSVLPSSAGDQPALDAKPVPGVSATSFKSAIASLSADRRAASKAPKRSRAQASSSESGSDIVPTASSSSASSAAVDGSVFTGSSHGGHVPTGAAQCAAAASGSAAAFKAAIASLENSDGAKVRNSNSRSVAVTEARSASSAPALAPTVSATRAGVQPESGSSAARARSSLPVGGLFSRAMQQVATRR